MDTRDFLRSLSLGKYTRWAEDLNEAELEAVLWAVGEFACRSGRLMELLERHEAELPPGFASERARWALGVLARVYAGERLTVGDLREDVRPIIDRKQAMQSEYWENEEQRRSGG